MRNALRTVVVGLALLSSPAAAVPECTSDAARIVGAAQKIATPEGIDELVQVNVGDQRQWISIRGRNRANPVLLVIHGGPGTPTMPISWLYQSPWEDFFTVVNWDQRGVGKNAPGADIESLVRTTSLDLILSDGNAVIDYLRDRFGKDKVALLGFSWGSLVGVKLAERHPEKISVYVGMGQIGLDGAEEGNRAEIIAAAGRADDDKALEAMNGLGSLAKSDGALDLPKVRILRQWGQRYNGMWYGHDSLSVMTDAAQLSPLYCPDEVTAFSSGAGWLARSQVMQDMGRNNVGVVRKLKVPVVILQGRYDLATNHDSAKAWWRKLKAPRKTFITFERSAHFVMAEEPGRFLLALTNQVLPQAGGSPGFVSAPRTKARPGK